MEPRERFARNLRELREAKGMSQEEVAHRAGLHPTEVSRLERAAREPRLSTMARLAVALETSVSVLAKGI